MPDRYKKITPLVNFINIFRTNFSYRCCLVSFSIVTCMQNQRPKRRLYEKFVHRMLMKLTTVVKINRAIIKQTKNNINIKQSLQNSRLHHDKKINKLEIGLEMLSPCQLLKRMLPCQFLLPSTAHTAKILITFKVFIIIRKYKIVICNIKFLVFYEIITF